MQTHELTDVDNYRDLARRMFDLARKEQDHFKKEQLVAAAQRYEVVATRIIEDSMRRRAAR